MFNLVWDGTKYLGIVLYTKINISTLLCGDSPISKIKGGPRTVQVCCRARFVLSNSLLPSSENHDA